MNYELVKEMEREIVDALIDSAIEQDYHLGVHDGDEFTVRNSIDKVEITEALFTVDDETLILYRNGSRCGWFRLVHGNDGYDVVVDYLDNEHCRTVIATVEPLIDRLCEEWEMATA